MDDDKKLITTWADLAVEAEKLAEFHAAAVEAAEDLLAAATAESEIILRKALARHRGLKALPTFRVSTSVYAGGGGAPSLVLVN